MRPLTSCCVRICAVGAVLVVLAMAPIADAASPRIRVEYAPPGNPEHQALYDLLRQRRALERLAEIFRPFQLPIAVTLKTLGCDGVANAFYLRPEVRLCYEYLDEIKRTMPAETTEAGITPADAVVGQLFYVAAHEMGHAVFDLLDVPLFGRPEDAADQFAAYMMLQFGKDDARRLIGGAAYAYRGVMQGSKLEVPLEAFSSAHGAPAQRLYNLLCMAYGADPKLFGDVVEKGYLPQKRTPFCRGEYREVAFAFQQLIAPRLDQELIKQVFDRTRLPPADAPSVHK
jgi:hypothetical protein